MTKHEKETKKKETESSKKERTDEKIKNNEGPIKRKKRKQVSIYAKECEFKSVFFSN